MLKPGDTIQVKPYDADNYAKKLLEGGIHTKLITELNCMEGTWLEVTEVEEYRGKTWRDKNNK